MAAERGCGVGRRGGTVVAAAAAVVVAAALVALGVTAGLPAALLGAVLVAATVLGLRQLWPTDLDGGVRSAAPDRQVAGGANEALVERAESPALADAPCDASATVTGDEARAAAPGTLLAAGVEALPEGPIGPEHDPATGLWSRAALERALATAVREESWSYPGRVVMFVVFDDFNTIVDEHGREVGREVFAAAAQRLMACLRPGDIAVRHGIDGFVILLERNAVMSTARPVAERVIMAMAFPFMVGDQFLAMGACVGLTVSNGDLTPDGLLLTGIGAASIAKRAGRGHIIQVT